MLNIIPSADRHFADHGWLQTHWHFSFDSYYDPNNINWGALRVFNDDIIQPGQGFGRHGHRDMEIVTYVLDGALEHKDSLGNTGVIRPGEVQVMSAGSGIQHSEYNHSQSEPCHLLQLWILPRTKSQPPRWEQRQFPLAEQAGRLLPVVSSGEIADTLKIDQAAAIYLSSLKPGDKVAHPMQAGRKAYAFVTQGVVTLNGQALETGDQARISDERELKFAISGDESAGRNVVAVRNAHFMLLDLPS